ncbi:MAG: acyltransferase [Betaproteobacteria bacterium]|nr:acyltransferase [Betaproteobacteria bacterium]
MKEKYGSIQMMRGIAALSVVFMHIGMVENGAFGVDLFFCISGFIMMHVTEKSGYQFLQKRAIRIIPLYWLTTIVISALVLIKPDFFKTLILTPEYFIKSLLFIPFYYTGVSGQSIRAINFVGWTLILEVFFYILFFISIKINHKYRHYIATGILVFLAIIGLTVKPENMSIRFYCMPIMLEFSLGMFAYKFLTKPNTRKWGTSTAVVAIFAAILIWASLFAQKYFTHFTEVQRFITAGLPSIAFFLLLFKALEGRSVPRSLMILGNISYSLYLIHTFTVQGFSRLVYDIDTYSPLGVVLTVVAVFPITIFVSWVSWWLIENKFTEWIKRQLKI